MDHGHILLHRPGHRCRNRKSDLPDCPRRQWYSDHHCHPAGQSGAEQHSPELHHHGDRSQRRPGVYCEPRHSDRGRGRCRQSHGGPDQHICSRTGDGPRRDCSDTYLQTQHACPDHTESGTVTADRGCRRKHHVPLRRRYGGSGQCQPDTGRQWSGNTAECQHLNGIPVHDHSDTGERRSRGSYRFLHHRRWLQPCSGCQRQLRRRCLLW